MRWQAIDRSSVGKPALVRSAAWRRDGTSTRGGAARVLSSFQMFMADADYDNTQLADLDKNYKRTPTEVVRKRTLNVVDWTRPPTTPPAPFTNPVKFDKPYAYRGVDAFIWEVRYEANTGMGTDYPFDFQYAGSSSGYSSFFGQTVGTSCKATGRTSSITLSITFYNHGTKFRISRFVSQMPGTASVLLNVDVKDQNLSFPGLCTKIQAFPLIVLPLGVASSAGTISGGYFDNIPHDKGLVGAKLWFQAWSVDPGQTGLPIVLSYAKSVTIPADPIPTQVTRYYHYKNTPTGSLETSGPWYGGIITKFN